MRVHALFGNMTALVDRIQFLRQMAGGIGAKLPEQDALRAELTRFVADAEEVRKNIVATKEGGAITGEERLREHTDQLYGAILGYEGRPGDYQVARIDALEAELAKVTASFDALSGKSLPPINNQLKQRKLPELTWPPQGAPVAEAGVSSADGNVGGMSAPGKSYRHPLAGLRL